MTHPNPAPNGPPAPAPGDGGGQATPPAPANGPQGGSGQQGSGQGNPAGSGSSTPDGQGDDLAKVKAALERERALRRDAEKKARELPAAQARVEELENAGKTENEQAIAKAGRDAHAAAMKTANGRLIAAEARALAAEANFRDPRDAARFLDLDDVTVADDGTVDEAAIKARLVTLATEKPYLIAETVVPPPVVEPPAGPRAPRPDHSQGGGRAPIATDVERGQAEAARRFGTRAAAAPAAQH